MQKNTCCQHTSKHFDGSHSNKNLHTAYLKSNKKYFQNPKYDIQFTVISHLTLGFTLQTARHTAFLHTASLLTGWNLTMIHYQIQLSNWIPTVKMLKLSNGFKNRMIVLFLIQCKIKISLYTCIYKGMCMTLWWLTVVTQPYQGSFLTELTFDWQL